MADRIVLTAGETAPPFTLTDQHGEPHSLSDYVGKPVMIYFYPRANTPGCTTQACGLRDAADQIGDTVVLGISPDKPEALAKFDDKFTLGFTLLSDTDHAVAEAYGAWGEKNLYGKKSMGIIRSAALVGRDGTLVKVWRKIGAAETPERLIAALATLD